MTVSTKIILFDVDANWSLCVLMKGFRLSELGRKLHTKIWPFCLWLSRI